MLVGRKSGFLMVAMLVCALAWPLAPATADDGKLPEQSQEDAERAREMIEKALGNIIAGLKLMMDSIPQYEAPEVLENGDILIRRKRTGPDEDETNQDI